MPPENETDIFGEVSTEPSLSGDDLNWEPDDTFAIEDASLPTGDEDANTNDGEGELGTEGAEADEDNGDDAAEDATGNADELPEQFRGKSPTELVKMIQDSQGFIQKQGNEIGDLRKMVEAVQAAQADIGQQEMVPAAEYIATEQDGLIAYREGISMLDRGELGPDAIDEIIDVMRDINPVVAAKMDRDFGMRLARAEMHMQMAPVIQQSYNDALRQATVNVNADPDAEAYREDIVRIVQQPQTYIERSTPTPAPLPTSRQL
jgi:hypothetical protein